MAFRLRGTLWVDFVAPGLGPMGGATAVQESATPAGGMQTQAFQTLSNTVAGYLTNTFTAADVATMLAAVTTDMTAQMTAAAVLARIQAWSSGGL